jgi:signal transduction histidine kinase
MKTPKKSKPSDQTGNVEQKLFRALLEKDRLGYMGYFTQGLIHNINGPLQNISMLTEFVAKGQDLAREFVAKRCSCENPEAYDAICAKQQQRLQQLAGQISTVVEMLRDFMWLHEVERNESEMDLNLLIRKLIQVFRADLFFKHNVELELRLGDNLPLVKILGRHLISALVHLFNNAMTAVRGAQGKKLVIETKLEEKTILLVFRDTGTGFATEGDQALFKPFFSDWSSTSNLEQKDNEQHFGLGLFVVESVLKPYGVKAALKRVGNETLAILEIPVQGASH